LLPLSKLLALNVSVARQQWGVFRALRKRKPTR
jgi:hypothetical protein